MAKNIYVGNLNFKMTQQELQTLFSEFGPVTHVRIVTDRESGRSKGFAFVEMESDQDADNAIEGLNGKDITGRPLKVNEARPREANGGGGGGGGGAGGGGSRGPRRSGGGGGGGGGFGGGPRNRY